MRCILVGPSAPLRGGIAIDNDARAQALQQAGHEVELVNFSRLYPTFLFPGRSQHDATTQQRTTTGGATVHLDSLNPLSWRRVAQHITAQKPHAVTFQWWHPFFAPCYLVLLRALQKTLPHTLRVLISHHARPHEPLPGQDVAVSAVIKRCTGVIAYSQSDYDVMTSLVPSSQIHLHDYPLLETSRELPSREAAQQRLGVSGRVLLFFGYVRAYKGLDILVEALAHVPSDVQVSLLVAGEFYTPVEETRQRIQALGLQERVRLIDRYIGEPEWPTLFAASDAIVLPYRAASQSMTIPLAYGFGKPVIATRVGGFADIIDHGRTGLLSDPNAGALAQTIRSFYSDFLSTPYEYAITAKRRSFGWESFIQLLEEDSRGRGQTPQPPIGWCIILARDDTYRALQTPARIRRNHLPRLADPAEPSYYSGHSGSGRIAYFEYAYSRQSRGSDRCRRPCARPSRKFSDSPLTGHLAISAQPQCRPPA